VASGHVIICDGCGKTTVRPRKPRDGSRAPLPDGWRRLTISSGGNSGHRQKEICGRPSCAAKVIFDDLSDDEVAALKLDDLMSPELNLGVV
jgi:hypothetical protein